MKLSLEYVAGGHILRGWYDEGEQDGTPDSGAPIDFVGFLVPVSREVVEVKAALGRRDCQLDHRMVRKIGRRALELGFTELRFERTGTGRKLRWARLIRSEDGFDYYAVTLAEALTDELRRTDPRHV